MKRTLVKYYLLFALLIPELKVLAQLDRNYHSGGEALKQSELFPNKFIRSRNKYVFNKNRLKPERICSILAEKNDKEINLKLEEAKSNRKTSNRAYLIGIPTTIAGIGFIASGVKYISEHQTYNYFTNTGYFISKEDLAYGRKLENIGLGISIVSAMVLTVATTYSIKSKRAIKGAVKIYNQKY